MSLPDPNPDTPMRKDMRQIAVLLIAGGMLEAAVTGQIVGGFLLSTLGAVALLASHYRS